jgi:hypothetical protein
MLFAQEHREHQLWTGPHAIADCSHCSFHCSVAHDSVGPPEEVRGRSQKAPLFGDKDFAAMFGDAEHANLGKVIAKYRPVSTRGARDPEDQ